MKKYLLIIFLFSSAFAASQDIPIDSLRKSLVAAKEDTIKIQLLRELGYRYIDTKPDSSLILYKRGLALARQDKLSRWEAIMLARVGYALGHLPGGKDSSLIYMQQAMALLGQNGFYSDEAWCYTRLSELYFFIWKKPDPAFQIVKNGIEFTEKNNLPQDQLDIRRNLADYHIQSGKPDSALELCFDGVLISQKKKLPEIESEYLGGIYNTLEQARSVDERRLLLEKAMAWARKNKQKKYEGYFLWNEGHRYLDALRYPEAFNSLLAAIKIFEAIHAEEPKLVQGLNDIGQIYYNLAEYRHSLSYYSRALALQEKLNGSARLFYQRVGSNYAKLGMHDSAIYFAKKCYALAERSDNDSQFGYLLDDIAEIYAEVGEDSIAMLYFRRSLPKFLPTDPYYNLNKAEIFVGIAKLFKKAGQNDSAFFYASLALPLAQNELLKGYEKVNLTGYLYGASNIIAGFYKSKRRLDSAFVYQEIAIAAKDSLSGQEKLKELQNIEFNETLRQQQAKEDAIKDRNRINNYLFLGGIAVVLLIALFLYRNNRIKQKANLVLQEQKQKIESTLEQLRSTQSQLIQSEKMASLGELTAGIAHEIQNPLNFVNNFSEVNNELIEELKSQKSKLKTEEQDEILNDIFQNNEKINHHGKRADAIVKGMLQHSRSSSGIKEPTDINALADEYLRLAYHGLRAKDKSFNATIKSDFDKTIRNINVIPQDIGRVVLNLINNAFYAVDEKKKQNLNVYEPTVSVTTKKNNGKVEISVKDNGNGIPQKIMDKIFQPFFTTKPTGQGTGLGLSLSYDIVKAHGGEIKVETKEGKGSEFIVQLPG